MQGICDSTLIFTQISFRSGSWNDKGVWNSSLLSKRWEKDCRWFYLIGDSGYALSRNFLVPYPTDTEPTPQMLYFNYILSSTRMAIERAFGLLKNKFRILHSVLNFPPKKACRIILACVVLHNIFLRSIYSGGNFDAYAADILSDFQVSDEPEVPTETSFTSSSNTAKLRRDELAKYLFMNRT